MPKKTKLSDEEIELFRQAIKGTKPLIHNKIHLSPPPTPKPTKRSIPEKAFPFIEDINLASVKAEDFICYKQPGISNKVLRKLRKGQYNVEKILDLHGMTTVEAEEAIDHLLQQALHQGVRTILIIHGKGHHSDTPILKNKVNHWLRAMPAVLAFCSATTSHGNRGAIYILLKKKNIGENSF